MRELLFLQQHTLKAAIIPNNNNNNNYNYNKERGMLSLTEDGKPGGTFRTFFV